MADPELHCSLSPSFDEESSTPFRGYIDIIGGSTGIEGWAINKSDPGALVPIELCVDGHVVARCMTGLAREDIREILGTSVNPGFRFGPEAMESAAAEAQAKPNSELNLRVGGTQLDLIAGHPLPTAGQVAKLIAEEKARNLANCELSLHTLLPRLANQARDLLAYPLRRTPENMVGFIETVTINPAGYVWFIGWMKKGHILDFGAVVADGGKSPAGVAVMCFERVDLGNQAYGVIGVIASEWAPNMLSQDFTLFFGNEARYSLCGNKPLRFLSAIDFFGEVKQIRAGYPMDGRGLAFFRLLNDVEHWSVSSASSQGFVAYADVDRLLLIPGFGYMAEGWILSPAKRYNHLELRVQNKTFWHEAETLYYKPRPDLLNNYPDHQILVPTAGFVACFPGDVTSEDVASPTLRIVFEDGNVWNQTISPDVVRQLGHSANLEDLTRFYPSLQDEPFFHRIAGALRPASTKNAFRIHAVEPAKSIAIFILPPDRSDLVALFAEIADEVSVAKDGFGVAFVAPLSASRSDVVWLFADLSRSLNVPTSLFFVDDGVQPLESITSVLKATGAHRFLFVGASVFLSEVGWEAARNTLVECNDNLEFLVMEGESWQSLENADLPLSLCFAWSSPAFLSWGTTKPYLLAGHYRDNCLSSGAGNVVLHEHAGRLTRQRYISAFEAAINDERTRRAIYS